jgi:AcrR family transcriptional regulator
VRLADTPPKQTRTKRRRAQIFDNLVHAGLAVIGKRGLYETTVEHITEAADVGKGTFYAHFASKEDLVFYLVRHGFDELIAGRRQPPGRTPRAGGVDLDNPDAGATRDLVILLHQVAAC